MMKSLKGKNILVTGCCGSVGAELTRQLLSDPRIEPAGLVGLDNDESALFFQEQRHDRRVATGGCPVNCRLLIVARRAHQRIRREQ